MLENSLLCESLKAKIDHLQPTFFPVPWNGNTLLTHPIELFIKINCYVNNAKKYMKR